MHLVARAKYYARELRFLHVSSNLRALRRESKGSLFSDRIHDAKARYVPPGEQFVARPLDRQREQGLVRLEDDSIRHEQGMVAVELHPFDDRGSRGPLQDQGSCVCLLEAPDRANFIVP